MDYFRNHAYRRVKKDRTIQLSGRVFEVSAKLIDKAVDLLFHSTSPDEVEVKYQGASYGKALLVNVVVISRVGRDWSTTHEPKITPPPPHMPPIARGGQLFDSLELAKFEGYGAAP